MATPPRRWVAYALLTAGLLLLYDTYTFIKTDWSPLRIPMSVPVELIFGCALILAGIFTFFAPTLLSAISEIALDPSMKMGHQLVHESIELRRQQRLPLRTKFVSLPNRGLLGVYVQLSPQLGQAVDESCLSGPILLRVKQHDGSSRVVLDGQEMQWSELRPTLISKLSGRANWEVFVEADEDVELSVPVQTFEIIRSLGAKAVILTPTLKKQLVDSCMSLLQVD
jgi:hypothetical protein